VGALGLWLCAQLALFVVTAPREARAQLSLSMRASASTSTSSSSSSSSSEASARGQALFQADFFSDTRWSEAVCEEVRSEEREPNRTRPQLERSNEAAASGQAYTRGTIDQQVLQSRSPQASRPIPS